MYWTPSTCQKLGRIQARSPRVAPVSSSLVGSLALSFRTQPCLVPLKASMPPRPSCLFVQRSFIFIFKISLKVPFCSRYDCSLKWSELAGERVRYAVSLFPYLPLELLESRLAEGSPARADFPARA